MLPKCNHFYGHQNTYSYQVVSVVFQILHGQTDRQTNTRTDAAKTCTWCRVYTTTCQSTPSSFYCFSLLVLETTVNSHVGSGVVVTKTVLQSTETERQQTTALVVIWRSTEMRRNCCAVFSAIISPVERFSVDEVIFKGHLALPPITCVQQCTVLYHENIH